MSKIEILAELPKLTSRERYEIRLKLAELDAADWLDADDPLTVEQKELIESRIEAHENNPGTAVPWEEFKARIDLSCTRFVLVATLCVGHTQTGFPTASSSA